MQAVVPGAAEHEHRNASAARGLLVLGLTVTTVTFSSVIDCSLHYARRFKLIKKRISIKFGAGCATGQTIFGTVLLCVGECRVATVDARSMKNSKRDESAGFV
jgi:hypothetical protein